jgi:hypothetical protein
VTPYKSRKELIEEAAAAKVLMDQHRAQMAIAAQWRAQAIGQLRGDGMSVTEIADALGISPPAVYKASGDMGVGTSTGSSSVEIDDLRGRIAMQLSLTRNIIDGRTPVAVSPHGWQLLANDLAAVVEVLSR